MSCAEDQNNTWVDVMSRTIAFGWLGLLAIGMVLAIWWWLPPSTDRTSVDEQHQTTAAASHVASPRLAASSGTPSAPYPAAPIKLAPSLQGTDIDCPVQADPQGQLLINKGLITCFDYFFSMTGEQSDAQILQDIRLYLQQSLPLEAATYASQLLDQYVRYKHAEQHFDGQADAQHPAALQRLLNEVKQLRRQYFSPIEAQALFGDSELLHQYSIDQLSILRDPNRSAQDKAVQLAALLNALPPALAEPIRTSTQYLTLKQLTRELKAQQASAAELQQMRTALVGAEAATRLEQLDQSRQRWQQRIQSYLAERQYIINSTVDPTDQARAIAALRERTFADQASRIRAEAFEAMHDRGETVTE